MPTVQAAFDFLTEQGPQIFGGCRSMLYVGHRADTHPWWRTTFRDAIGIQRLAVIDIEKRNLESAEGITDDLQLGDIRKFVDDRKFVQYDLVFWDEGPEHLPKLESLKLLYGMRPPNPLGTRVLVSCPWGYQPQGSGPSDIEFHHWGPMPEDFEGIGMQAATFGEMFDGRGNGHGNLLAWY